MPSVQVSPYTCPAGFSCAENTGPFGARRRPWGLSQSMLVLTVRQSGEQSPVTFVLFSSQGRAPCWVVGLKESLSSSFVVLCITSQPDGQLDRQPTRQTARQTARQPDRQLHSQTASQSVSQKDRQKGRHVTLILFIM